MLSKKDAVAAGHFQTYIAKAEDIDLNKALRKNAKAFRRLLKEIPVKKRDYAYGEGKWTIKELLQHIIDAERVFAYRALRFARKDATPLPGFDENLFATSANKIMRNWDDLVSEFKRVRDANELLFASLGEEELLFEGNASGNPINALAMGYVIVGHVQHHMDLIAERYLAKAKKPKAQS